MVQRTPGREATVLSFGTAIAFPLSPRFETRKRKRGALLVWTARAREREREGKRHKE